MSRACRHEPEVLEAVALYQWPERCDAGLRAHVAGCAVCREVAEVALVFRDDHAHEAPDVRLPPAERVWWRAQLRARLDDADRAARPVSIAQAGAAAAAGGLAVGAASYVWPRVPWGTLQAIYEWMPELDAARLIGGTATIPQLLLLAAIGAAAGIVLMPVALYFVLSE